MSDPIPFARGGAYPPRAGNEARPLVDGEPAFRRIAEAVRAARASVWVTVAFVERDLVLPAAGGTLFNLLVKRRKPIACLRSECRRKTCGTRARPNSAAGRWGRRRSAYEAPRAAAIEAPLSAAPNRSGDGAPASPHRRLGSRS